MMIILSAKYAIEILERNLPDKMPSKRAANENHIHSAAMLDAAWLFYRIKNLPEAAAMDVLERVNKETSETIRFFRERDQRNEPA